jgi:hypothetical protein
MHGKPRGGNRRIVLLLLAVGRASPSWPLGNQSSRKRVASGRMTLNGRSSSAWECLVFGPTRTSSRLGRAFENCLRSHQGGSEMQRREFVGFLRSRAAVVPFAARAQRQERRQGNDAMRGRDDDDAAGASLCKQMSVRHQRRPSMPRHAN